MFWGIRVACYKTVICNVSHDDWRSLVVVYVKSVYNFKNRICCVAKGREERDFGLRKLRLSFLETLCMDYGKLMRPKCAGNGLLWLLE